MTLPDPGVTTPPTDEQRCRAQVVTRLGIATCNDHLPGFGHHDTRLLLSWPEGDGLFATTSEAQK